MSNKEILKILAEMQVKLDMLLSVALATIETNPELKERFNGMRVPDECAGDCPECECK